MMRAAGDDTAAAQNAASRGTPTGRWWLVVMLTSGMTLCYAQRGTLSIAAPFMIRELGINTETMGLMLSAFSWCYCFMQVPSGWIVDRFGVRRASRMIAPFFVIPWLLMPLGAWLGVLTGNRWVLTGLGVGLALAQRLVGMHAGTLTAAERQIINHHIDVTIQMLEALPWPKHLKNVPEYAGGHHERMDGKGYPRGLTRDQMSVQARCMGIADIFEALTAKDRPYKKGKTLSESLSILGKFKLGGHIDPDLFDVFMWQKVYLKYAEKCMDKHQIDDVDLAQVPGYVPPPAA